MSSQPVNAPVASESEPPVTRWDRFEEAGRQRATRAGKPVPRLAIAVVQPAAPSRDEFMSDLLKADSWLVSGRSLQMRQLGDRALGEAQPLDVDELTDALIPADNPTDVSRSTIGGVLVVPDAGTLNRLLRRAAQSYGGHLARAIGVCRALPFSTRVVVLTEALAAQFFLPVGSDPLDLGDWCRAFGLGSDRSVKHLPSLYRAVRWAPEGCSTAGLGARLAEQEA